MRRLKWLAMTGLLIPLGITAQRPAGEIEHQNDAVARSLIDMERQWAEVDVKYDATVLENILANDFLGTSTEGKLYNKSQAMTKEEHPAVKMLSNHLNDVKVRFFGNVAVLHGSETFRRKAGEKIETGTYIWTDTWLRRNGRWQIIAAQDMLAPEKK